MYDSTKTALRIKSFAKAKKILIQDVLKECDLNINILATMQFRKSWPKSNNLAKIADSLNCSVDYLLGRTDNPEINR